MLTLLYFLVPKILKCKYEIQGPLSEGLSSLLFLWPVLGAFVEVGVLLQSGLDVRVVIPFRVLDASKSLSQGLPLRRCYRVAFHWDDFGFIGSSATKGQENMLPLPVVHFHKGRYPAPSFT